MADAGHESRKLARHLLQHEGWKLVITRRSKRAFKIKGLTWIVERSFAWLGVAASARITSSRSRPRRR